MGGKEHFFTAGVSANWCSHDAPQKARKRSTAQSSYTTLEHIPKELYILLQSYLLIHIQCCSIYKIHEMERT